MARKRVVSVWTASAAIVSGPGGMGIPTGHSAGIGMVRPMVPLRVLRPMVYGWVTTVPK